MSVELTIETVEETIVLELQDHVPAVLTIDNIPELRDELDSKVDKVEGYSLVADDDIDKLSTVEQYATANRPDAQNADKIHEHVIADVAELAAKLELINQWLQVPADKKYFNFVGNRYSENGAPAPLPSLGSTFTRLSAATQWKDGVLVDVSANVMRLDKAKGLLIEPQRTNLFYPSEFKDGSNVTATTIDVGGRSVDAVQFQSGPTAYVYAGAALTDGVIHSSSFYVQMDDGLIPIFSASASGPGTDFALNINGVTQSGNLLISKESSNQYRVKGSQPVTFPLRSSGIVKYSGNSDRGFKTSMRQIEAGELSSTYIKTTSKVETRAKETLVVPFTAGQVVTADKDTGVTMTITGTNAVFEGHGYIRSVRVN